MDGALGWSKNIVILQELIYLYELVFVANIGFFLALLNFSSGIIDAYLTWEHNNKEYLVLFKQYIP